MHRVSLTIALLACLGLAGCGQSASQRLVGKWKSDLAKAAKGAVWETDGPASATGTMLGLAEAVGMKMEMEIEFKADQTMTTSATWFWTETSGTMDWEVARVDGGTVTVAIRWPDDRNATELQIIFVDEDHFQLAPPGGGGKSFVFTRLKEE